MTLWNMEWLILSIRIGIYGFLKEFRPEDPYITQYLTNHPMNFTNEEVYQDIFPVATYVSLSLLIIVFLLTDWLRYKPVIIMHAFSGIMMQVFLIWCRAKWTMYIMEFWYGMMTACEIAYYTYIYAKVDKKHYQVVTSHMRGASLAGRFLSGVTSQILIHFKLMTVADLNYLTLGGISLGFVWALTLPPVKSSIYFHRTNSAVDFNDCTKAETCHAEIGCASELEQEQLPVLRKICSKSVVFPRMWADLKHAYTNLYVLKWSIWWAIATCGYNQVMTYVQTLWEDVSKAQNFAEMSAAQNWTDAQNWTAPTQTSTEVAASLTIYNGATEAIYTIISASSAFYFGFVKVDWKIYGEILLGVCTFLEGILILWSSHVNVVIFAYIAYILFGMLYHIMMTVSNSEVARHIRSDSYALIFGINTFFAVLLQTILTMVVNDKNSLFQLNIRQQYVVYGSYFIALGVIFTLKAVFTKLSRSLHYTW